MAGSFDITGRSAFTNSGFDAFSGLAASEADTSPTVALSTATLGVFSETITLDATGSNTSGYAAALTPVTLTIQGEIIPCFARGTRIATPTGYRTVERLGVGDLVLTRSGRARPAIWIGERKIDCRRHNRPQAVLPVLIQAGAFAENVPARDLLLSPDHAMFSDGALVPIKYLINGTTIAQQDRRTQVHYFHVELDRHDVVLAEGLEVESYLDTGDRNMFANGGGPVVLHPDFSQRTWEAAGYAPLVVTGVELDRLRRQLQSRTRRVLRTRKTRAAG
jgi:hypothetical protein